jgi:hypothetical protein
MKEKRGAQMLKKKQGVSGKGAPFLCKYVSPNNEWWKLFSWFWVNVDNKTTQRRF